MMHAYSLLCIGAGSSEICNDIASKVTDLSCKLDNLTSTFMTLKVLKEKMSELKKYTRELKGNINNSSSRSKIDVLYTIYLGPNQT